MLSEGPATNSYPKFARPTEVHQAVSRVLRRPCQGWGVCHWRAPGLPNLSWPTFLDHPEKRRNNFWTSPKNNQKQTRKKRKTTKTNTPRRLENDEPLLSLPDSCWHAFGLLRPHHLRAHGSAPELRFGLWIPQPMKKGSCFCCFSPASFFFFFSLAMFLFLFSEARSPS